MVNAGGDTRLLGDRRGKPWIVGIRDPRRDGVVVTRIPLADEAISTSGDYERFFEQDGVRHHHILVPGTGKSPSDVRSVTVIGPNATRTDGLTKPIFILGVDRGMAYVRRVGDVEAVIVDKPGPGLLLARTRARAAGLSPAAGEPAAGGAARRRFVTQYRLRKSKRPLN